jgi:hypothetical protein
MLGRLSVAEPPDVRADGFEGFSCGWETESISGVGARRSYQPCDVVALDDDVLDGAMHVEHGLDIPQNVVWQDHSPDSKQATFETPDTSGDVYNAALRTVSPALRQLLSLEGAEDPAPRQPTAECG